MFLGQETNIENFLRVLRISLSKEEMQRVYQVSKSIAAMSIEDSLEKLDFVSELLSEIIGVLYTFDAEKNNMI